MSVLMVACITVAFLLQFAASRTVEVKARTLTDSEIQLLRSDHQADKNDIIAHAMQCNNTESNGFWPIYRDYPRDQQSVGDELVQLIKDYAQNYDAVDDATAGNMVQRLLNIDAKFTTLRQQCWPNFEKARGAKRAAKFFQIDNRLSFLVNLQLTLEIPLMR